MLSKRFPDGKYGPQSHWKVAWARYRAGDLESARYLMAEQLRLYPDHFLTPAALYWSGRIAESSDAATAQALFKRAVENHPSNFYGFLSRERLTTPVTTAGIKYVAPAKPEHSTGHRHQFELMESLGLSDLAGAEMRHLIQETRKDQQAYWWLELATFEKQNGRIHVAIDSARRAIPQYTALDPDTVPASCVGFAISVAVVVRGARRSGASRA